MKHAVIRTLNSDALSRRRIANTSGLVKGKWSRRPQALFFNERVLSLLSCEQNQSTASCNQRQREFGTQSPWISVLLAAVTPFIHNCFEAKEK